MRKRTPAPQLAAALLLAVAPPAHAHSSYREIDLISDVAGRAASTDSNLVNPWGIVLTHDGSFRISDNGAGVSTAYDRQGDPRGPSIVIPPEGSGNPTGVALNRFEDAFAIGSGKSSVRSTLIFASEDGSISAWGPNLHSDHAVQVATTEDAVYKGLALGSNETGPFLFAANFHAGTIDVFDRHFAPVTWTGAFSDPNLPDGYAPFNLANLGGRLIVTFAKQDDARHDNVSGDSLGIVDVFDTRGHLLRRFASHGPLDAPWGIALAPGDFGRFGHALLIGNFGNGFINAFNPRTGEFLGHLSNADGSPIAISGLWGLAFGAEGENEHGEGEDEHGDDHARDSEHGRRLYFTAGIAEEAHGLLGLVEPAGREAAPEPIAAGGDDPATKPLPGSLRVAPLGANPVRLADRAGVHFRISLGTPGAVELRIFDAAGRLVAEPLKNSEMGETVEVRWDGSDVHGSRVGPGAYFYRAVAGSHTVTGRLVLIP